MKKFVGIGITFGIILVLIGIAGFLLWNFLFPTPHEHYSLEETPIIESFPTCVTNGMEYKICDGCGEKYGANVLNAKGHELGDSIIEDYIAPDCINKGSYKEVSYCLVCHKACNVEHVIDELGHKAGEPEIENKVEATCDSDGSYETVVYCSVCRVKLSCKAEIIKSSGHVFNGEALKNEYMYGTEGISYSDENPPVCGTTVGASVECETCHKDVAVSVVWDHTYEWSLKMPEEDVFVMQGKCSCGNKEVIPIDKSKVTSQRFEPSCCSGAIVYTASIEYKGVAYTREFSIEIKPLFNHMLSEIDIIQYAAGSDNYGYYYYADGSRYVSENRGIYVDENAVWDANGFTMGVFKCSHCDSWVGIRIFDPDRVIETD